MGCLTERGYPRRVNGGRNHEAYFIAPSKWMNRPPTVVHLLLRQFVHSLAVQTTYCAQNLVAAPHVGVYHTNVPASRLIGSDVDAASGRGCSGIIQQGGAGQVGDAAPSIAAGTPEGRHPSPAAMKLTGALTTRDHRTVGSISLRARVELRVRLLTRPDKKVLLSEVKP